MTTPLRQFILNRGHTATSSTYTGPSGEITYDTGVNAIRIHDGITPGGNLMPSNTLITAVSSNIAILQANVSTLFSNAAVQAVSIDTKSNLTGAVFSGNVQAPWFLANSNIEAEGFLKVGPAHDQGQNWANPGALFFGNTSGMLNTYYQINLQNVDPEGSGDVVVTANDGNDAMNYITMGIHNSLYYDPVYPTSLPHDGYVYTIGGNLYLSTQDLDVVISASDLALTRFSSNNNVYFQSNLIPAANVTYSLGSETHQWQDLWVSNNTIYIGNTPISVDGSTLLVNGQPAAGTYNNTNVASYLSNFDGTINFTGSPAIISGLGSVAATYANVTAVYATGNITGNTAGYAIGYRDIPQVTFTGNTTIDIVDAGKHFYSTQSTDHVLTIANSASQSFQIGAAITVVNQGTGNITIAQGSGVTLYMAGNATASDRTLSAFGMATVMKVDPDTWFINGTGVS